MRAKDRSSRKREHPSRNIRKNGIRARSEVRRPVNIRPDDATPGGKVEEVARKLRVAHFVRFSPHQSGLYETTRDICLAEKALGIDAVVVDTTFVEEETAEPQTKKFDRGLDLIPCSEAENADIYVIHSILPKRLYGKKPAVLLLHGAPEYVFYSEVLHNDKGERGFSTLLGYKKQPWLKRFITMWPRHVPYWQGVLGTDMVSFVPSAINLDDFPVEGEKETFVNHGELNIGFADSWRNSFFQGPFRILQGVREYWKRNPKAKLHLFGIPGGKKRDIVWDRFLFALRNNGDFVGGLYETRVGMDKVYRSLDLLITTNIDESRIVKEALCMGLRVIAPVGAEFTVNTADIASPVDLADCIAETLAEPFNREEAIVAYREEYDSKKMAAGLVEIFEDVLKENTATIST